jgi:hypothetical protein
MEQQMRPRHSTKWASAGMLLVVYALVFGVRTAAAGGFGIAGLDGFLTTFATEVTGMGILVLIALPLSLLLRAMFG